jgi:hypothetical protein
MTRQHRRAQRSSATSIATTLDVYGHGATADVQAEMRGVESLRASAGTTCSEINPQSG